jgi:CIC family chloride channel protein
VLPAAPPGFWALMCLAGVLGGVMRAPFTGVVFAMELTHRWGAILPLLVTASAAYLVTALLLKRSVLTEKVARRGYHLTREYDIDPLAVLFVRDVMDVEDIVVYDADDRFADVVAAFIEEVPGTRSRAQRQRLYPVTSSDGTLLGVITRRDLYDAAVELEAGQELPASVAEVMSTRVVVAHPDDTLSDVAYRMAEHQVTRMPVVARGERPELVGIITLPALLAGRLRDLQEDRHAERVLRVASFRRWRTLRRSTPRTLS